MDRSIPGPARGCDLPPEIISIILSLLPTHSISKFRFVCKLWHRLITSDPLILETPFLIFQTACRLAPAEEPDPSLIDFIAETRGDNITVNQQSVPGFRLFSCCNGLLYFHPYWDHRGSSGYVCNPLLGESLVIPNVSTNLERRAICGFFYHKASNQYRLLRMTSSTNGSTEICKYDILAIGSESWRDIPWTTDLAPTFEAPINLNHVLHWLTWNFGWPVKAGHSILAFDTEAETFRLMQRPQGSFPATNARYSGLISQLIEMNGYLCLCQPYPPHRTDIWILKDYISGDSWERKYIIALNSIQIRSFFRDESLAVRIWIVPIYGKKDEIILYIREFGFVSYNIALKNFKTIAQFDSEGITAQCPTVFQRSHVSLLTFAEQSLSSVQS